MPCIQGQGETEGFRSILFSGSSEEEEKLNLKYLRRLDEAHKEGGGGVKYSKERRGVTIVDQPTERGLGRTG